MEHPTYVSKDPLGVNRLRGARSGEGPEEGVMVVGPEWGLEAELRALAGGQAGPRMLPGWS